MPTGQSNTTVRPPPNPRAARALGLGAILFGIATVVAGGRVLFGPLDARTAAGRVVPFVLWFNFLAGFAYVIAGAGIALGRRWAAHLSTGIAVGTAFIFVAFGVHVGLGGAFESRTVSALLLRTVAWSALAQYAWRRSGSPAGG